MICVSLEYPTFLIKREKKKCQYVAGMSSTSQGHGKPSRAPTTNPNTPRGHAALLLCLSIHLIPRGANLDRTTAAAGWNRHSRAWRHPLHHLELPLQPPVASFLPSGACLLLCHFVLPLCCLLACCCPALAFCCVTARLLACCNHAYLLADALICWGWPGSEIPAWQYLQLVGVQATA